MTSFNHIWQRWIDLIVRHGRLAAAAAATVSLAVAPVSAWAAPQERGRAENRPRNEQNFNGRQRLNDRDRDNRQWQGNRNWGDRDDWNRGWQGYDRDWRYRHWNDHVYQPPVYQYYYQPPVYQPYTYVQPYSYVQPYTYTQPYTYVQPYTYPQPAPPDQTYVYPDDDDNGYSFDLNIGH